MAALFFLSIWAVCALLALCGTLFWIWMLIDCAVNEPSGGNEKIIWILIIIFGHGIGALVYFFVRRPTRIARYG